MAFHNIPNVRATSVVKGNTVEVTVRCPFHSVRQVFERDHEERGSMVKFAEAAKDLARTDHIEVYHD